MSITTPRHLPHAPGLTEIARLDAIAAARRAGVEVRPLRQLDEIRAGQALLADVWVGEHGGPMSTNVLMGVATADNYLAGAFDGEDLLGVCVGFWGPPASRSMYSHIAGVAASARGRDLGFAMKLHQRAWAVANQVETIQWTFDPLVARNAHFNLHKLGGQPTGYLVNHYGRMDDAINGAEDTDRLLLTWRLGSRNVQHALQGRSPVSAAHQHWVPTTLLAADPYGFPLRLDGDGVRVRVSIPRDIERLRQTDPAASQAWRLAVRETLGDLLTAGAIVEDFDRTASAYILRKDPSA